MARVPTISKDVAGVPLSAHKTPVSWLHEVCTRSNVTPKYDLLQIEGAVHEPIFQYRLTLDYNGRVYEESGSGRSKKEAKHNTARAMLRSIQVVAPHELFEMDEPLKVALAIEAPKEEENSVEYEGDGNPVGILQELCMKLKYPPPTYDVAGEEGLPHERLFAMACSVGDQFVEIGKGKSKKIAKRTSAHNMATRLKAMPLVKSTARVYEDDDDVIIERLRTLKKLSSAPPKKKRKRKGKKKDGEGGDTVATTFPPSQPSEYKGMIGPIIDSLRDPNFSVEDPIAFVKKLGKEQNFEAMYIDSEDLSTNEEHQIMVQVTFDPPLVLIGSGKTFREAKRNAARDVITYFTQMIKKSKKDLKPGGGGGGNRGKTNVGVN